MKDNIDYIRRMLQDAEDVGYLKPEPMTDEQKKITQDYLDDLNDMLNRERQHRSFLLKRVDQLTSADLKAWSIIYRSHVEKSEALMNDINQRIEVQKLKLSGKAYRSNEYLCGFDCAVRGANPFNCYYYNFITIEARNDWQNGYDDGKRSRL
jgi:hypothetical protein